jgi:hypothetical protein
MTYDIINSPMKNSFQWESDVSICPLSESFGFRVYGA